MITIVDYGTGNLGSVANMLKKIDVPAIISNDLTEIASAKKILLPGVGAFDSAMEKLTGTELRKVLDHKALVEKVPILGICLGMQLLLSSSEEGKLPGLGWIQGSARKFSSTHGIKVPHMGWNFVDVQKKDMPLVAGFDSTFRFYFVHSYYASVTNPAESLLKTTHGTTFDSAIFRNNIMGAQFHPEKSLRFGMKFLKNFASL